MPLADTGTELYLTVLGVDALPFYSARGLTQTYKPIREIANNRNNIRRTVGAVLIDITPPEFRLLETVISSDDQRPPQLDSIWPGTTFLMGCCAYRAYPTGGTPDRAESSASAASFTEGPFTFYLPLLTVMLLDFNNAFAEWQAGNRWEMTFAEVGPALAGH